MSMTPTVAGARRYHKAKEIIASVSVGVALFLLCVASFFALASTTAETWKQMTADSEFRHVLVAASAKSEAHHFLVKNWLQCSSLFNTRTGCYASIRGAAASRGESFVRQVDSAAKELDLI